jgi:hypothetical protein
MLGFVTLPTNFTDLVAGNAGTIFSDLAPVAVMIAGVLLGLFVISWVISTLRKPSSTDITRHDRIESGYDDDIDF